VEILISYEIIYQLSICPKRDIYVSLFDTDTGASMNASVLNRSIRTRKQGFAFPVELKKEAWEKNMGECPKILVVDDDAGVREILASLLEQAGYKTEAAQTAKEAIEKCQAKSFDVALIDIKLPDMEGTKLLGMLNKFNPAMVKIMITGYPSLENAVQSLNSGADGYLMKPFESEGLLKQIEEQLERRQRTKWENALRNTGLSAYEAKIYLSLAVEGCSEARRLSMASGVPRTKAYAALRKLTERGLVFEIPGQPKRFSVTAPSTAFGTLVQSLKKELSEEATSLSELESAISTLESIHEKKQSSKPVNTRKEEIWSVQGRDEIKQRTSEMLSRANTHVYAITTERGLVLFYKDFRKILDVLAEKGVEIRINVAIGSSSKNFVRELRYAYKVENTPVTVPVFFLCVDEKELLLARLRTDDFQTDSDNDVALFSQSETLCSFFSSLLHFDKCALLASGH
jgi:sugar-specific transcriptional regulator TrmB/CheY-like chemotaxis protein